jgi:phospholipid/cholesterol/gamma-HCH transport system permease protein
MQSYTLDISKHNDQLLLKFSGELSLYIISSLEYKIDKLRVAGFSSVCLDFDDVISVDTAVSIYINNLLNSYKEQNLNVILNVKNQDIKDTFLLVKEQPAFSIITKKSQKNNIFSVFGKEIYINYLGLLSFFNFLGMLFKTKIFYMKSFKNIRFKEIAFEINESGIKALPIISLTSFLIGLVVAYQSAFQLKIYGANIFLVDMLGISILRELAPLITAIVIAGRSGSAFTAQIGAMKITEELDAMRTMGFDPYIYLVLPRILALMITMPILIFVADIIGILGGMIVANIDLQISPTLFLERFREVIEIKHFYIGIIKGPFFAFLIASIGIYKGFKVKDDTQSIGFNTTKSVVESIFAVIVCDAIFSIALTNLGI